jgi:hypothetical protein
MGLATKKCEDGGGSGGPKYWVPTICDHLAIKEADLAIWWLLSKLRAFLGGN